MEREILRKKHNRFILNMILLIVLVILIGVFIIFHQSQSPFRQIRGEASGIAKRDAGVQKVDNFYISNLNQTYYTVGGTNEKNQHLLVVIAKNGGKVTVLNQKDGLSIDQVKNIITKRDHPQKFFNISPAIYNNQPVWSVGYLNQNKQLCYCKVQFKNGKILQLINNV
ncbi:hypothetical protein WR164_08210 [Philodulcilactobacillus myokoensis]|uniref:Cell wall elongation regulator TseB-like domain-containing protein n=1 Tax=Philodulcilactobacillus myokoensis TaxID=2929573 RepID=A0A9W6B0Z7_9LACO|nr:DUF5590 domain-containing protein [Philodulcilactobacillus myokoensis]GLB46842.1 hypothetical protein WR164_08210 [Philodulcilactobacillus myokoensis]